MEAEVKEFPARFEIGPHAVGRGERCLVIAEAGVNHFGSLDKAYGLIDLAVSAGADLFKLQHYDTDKLVGPSAPEWRDRLRTKQITNDAVAAIKRRCEEKGITFLCTPHDETALDFLDKELDVGAFKIGSGEVENWPFLANVARRGKPIVLSTGMYTLEQIRQAIEVVRESGCPPLAVLHCITSYPTPPSIVNLRVMHSIREMFPGPVGYSDHTIGTAVPLAAVALGADVIEEHITLDRDVPNAQDWIVSCDPTTFPNFVRDLRATEAALGSREKSMSAEEARSIQWARKSLTAATAIPAGSSITEAMLVAQRPGTGLPPSRLAEVIGRRAVRDIAQGAVLTAADLGMEG
jgi:N-acetylneuraminate synthase/N,N'-diacetyllegionaminate synthase